MDFEIQELLITIQDAKEEASNAEDEFQVAKEVNSNSDRTNILKNC